MQIRRVIPDFENQLCDVAFTLFGRKYPNGLISTYGPYTSSVAKTKIDMLKKMRELKLRIDYSAAPAGWRLGALRLDIERRASAGDRSGMVAQRIRTLLAMA